jgi:hypothetical protein
MQARETLWKGTFPENLQTEVCLPPTNSQPHPITQYRANKANQSLNWLL